MPDATLSFTDAHAEELYSAFDELRERQQMVVADAVALWNEAARARRHSRELREKQRHLRQKTKF